MLTRPILGHDSRYPDIPVSLSLVNDATQHGVDSPMRALYCAISARSVRASLKLFNPVIVIQSPEKPVFELPTMVSHHLERHTIATSSALPCRAPDRCSVEKSISPKRSSHRACWSMRLGALQRYQGAEWSLSTMKCRSKIYALNCRRDYYRQKIFSSGTVISLSPNTDN